MTTATDAFDLDGIELPDELPVPERVSIQRLAIGEFAAPPERIAASRRTRGKPIRPMMHIAWEPLNYRLDFNPQQYPDNPQNYDHQWITMFTDDGILMGPKSQFGQIVNAFKGLGYPIKNNESFKAAVDRTFKTKTVEEAFKKSDGTDGRSFNIVPAEELSDYKLDPQRPVRRIGYNGGGSGIAAAAGPSDEQLAALKVAVHGKSPDEYLDAVMFSGNALINCDPFVAEAGDPERLTARCEALGGKLVGGKMYFAEFA